MSNSRAGEAVARAIKDGRLTRQPCETCGREPEWLKVGPWAGHQVVIAHHDDYDRPLDVRWLCRRCHADHHIAQGSYANNGRRPFREAAS